MLQWLDECYESGKIDHSVLSQTKEVLEGIKSNSGFLFDCYHNDNVLNYKQRTTGVTEVENYHLKKEGVDCRST